MSFEDCSSAPNTNSAKSFSVIMGGPVFSSTPPIVKRVLIRLRLRGEFSSVTRSQIFIPRRDTFNIVNDNIITLRYFFLNPLWGSASFFVTEGGSSRSAKVTWLGLPP